MGLFPRPAQPQPNGIFAQISNLRRASGGDPQAAMQMLSRSNPQMASQFQQFMSENAGKSPEQIAREHGIDYSVVQRFIGR